MLSSAAGHASKRSKTIGPSSAGEQPISTRRAEHAHGVGAERAQRVAAPRPSVTASSTHISSRNETP